MQKLFACYCDCVTIFVLFHSRGSPWIRFSSMYLQYLLFIQDTRQFYFFALFRWWGIFIWEFLPQILITFLQNCYLWTDPNMAQSIRNNCCWSWNTSTSMNNYSNCKPMFFLYFKNLRVGIYCLFPSLLGG